MQFSFPGLTGFRFLGVFDERSAVELHSLSGRGSELVLGAAERDGEGYSWKSSSSNAMLRNCEDEVVVLSFDLGMGAID